MLLGTLFSISMAFAGGERFHFININERDGYSPSVIRSFLQDDKGCIWIGTEHGLVRYDGYRLETFSQKYNNSNSISGNATLSVLQDRWGKIWISTSTDGLNCYDPVRKRFTVYRHKSDDSTTLRTNELRRLLIDSKDRLWIGYFGKGWSILDLRSGRLTHHKAAASSVSFYGYDAGNCMEQLCEEKGGGMWLTSLYGLHYHAPDGRISTYTSITGTTNPHNDNLFTSVCRGDDTTLWLGTWGAGLKKFNTRTRKFTQCLWDKVNPNAAITNIILALLPKSDTELWVGTADRGLAVFNTPSGRFRFLPHEPDNVSSPLPGECYSLYKDRSGTLWAGFYTGASRLPHTATVLSFTAIRSFAPEYADQILPYDFYKDPATGLLYIGCNTGAGLYIVDEDKGTERVVRIPGGFRKDGGAYMMNIFSVVPLDAERLLLCTGHGFVMFNKRTGKASAHQVKDQKGQLLFTTKLHKTEAGYWCSNNGHIYFMSASVDSAYCYNKADPPDVRLPPGERSIVFAESDTAIWVNVKGEGLFRVNPERKSVTHIAGTRDAAFHGFAMIKDGAGRYWFASRAHGLFCITPAKAGKVDIRQFRETDGLASDHLGDLLFDRQGNLMVATTNGPCILFRGEERFISFRKNNLVTAGRPEFSTLYLDSTGRLYQGFRQGFYSWRNEELKAARTKPPLVLTSVKVFDKELFDTADVAAVRDIELAHDQNNIQLSFTAYDYLAPSETRYFSKLEGIDEHWRPCEKILSYSRLSHGRYTLRIRAVSGLGMPAANELEISIRIKPPFWLTAPFFLLCALMLGGIVLAIFRYRVAIIRKEERMKTDFNKTLAEVEMKALRAQMNPHFLFNCLNSINRYIVVKDTRRASSYLTKFSKLIRFILENSAQDAVSLGSEIELLRLYIEMEAMRFEDQFTYSIDIDPRLHPDAVSIPTMIIQPYVENAIWHGLLNKSGDRHLTLKFQTGEAGMLEAIIEDNGVGRKRAAELRSKDALKRKSYGMQITDNRIKVLNSLYDSLAAVRVEDLEDATGTPAGTRVTLRMPYKKLLIPDTFQTSSS